MDVFLIPLGATRYELYCEVAPKAVAADGTPGRRSWWRRQIGRFNAMLVEAEADRARRERGEGGNEAGLGRFIMRKIAEAIAEQRLLWHLRDETTARLVFPDDMNGDAALQAARGAMTLDYAKHRRWAIIDGLITAVTGPLFFFIPGPNVISWYFAFRAIGHYFAWRGARQGLHVLEWHPVPSRELAAIRAALGDGPGARRARLEPLAAALGLSRLAAYVDRVARRPA